jgi:uncharacterized protein (TIGR03435 family)
MRLTYILLATSVVGSAFAQGTPPADTLPQAFEVASVKPHLEAIPKTGGKISVSGSRMTVEIYSLFGLLMFAYDLKPNQIPGASALDHTFYDITADAGDGRVRTRDDFRPLMRALLADRFKLRVHLEDKEAPVYALVIDAKGSKLKASAPGAATEWHTAVSGRAFTRSFTNFTMAKLADVLRDNDGMDRPVIDKTGLTESYDFTLTYVPQNRMARGQDGGLDDADIFAAVKELGLRLEQQKSNITSLIVDHSEKPAEN